MSLKDSVDIAKNLATIAGVFVGAAWAYFKFFKSRTLNGRLELAVAGRVFEERSKLFLRVTISVRNVGLTKVSIRQSGTGLSVRASAALDDPQAVNEIRWHEESVFSILTDHDWIEPGEPITEDLLIAMPNDGTVAYKLRVRVIPDRKHKRTEWNATAIVPARPTATTAERVTG